MTQRFTDSYDDISGKIQSAQTGGTAWTIEAITGTPFIAGALRNNSTDIVQVSLQTPHRRKLGSILASIHIHYVLQAASNVNETIIWTGRYAWVNAGSEVPATANWIAFTGTGLTQNLGTAKNVRYYGIHTIKSDINAVENEGYGSILLIELTRGNGSYAGKLAILDVDAHSIMNRLGSENEASDN
jgi:hypothetical protein